MRPKIFYASNSFAAIQGKDEDEYSKFFKKSLKGVEPVVFILLIETILVIVSSKVLIL
ncbi:MAG: hypothetical protein QCI00_09050 [Candidatus Thermoplasmatota archaeon]|nr:hypothetical protein [Candidatus Thermoplasmatota archaeon]